MFANVNVTGGAIGLRMFTNVSVTRRRGDGEASESAIGAMIDAGAAGYRAALPTPVQLDNADLARLTMPTFVGLGARSAVTDTEAAARAARTLPNATVRLWPEGTHSLPMQYPDDLQAAWETLVARSGA